MPDFRFENGDGSYHPVGPCAHCQELEICDLTLRECKDDYEAQRADTAYSSGEVR